MVHHATLKYSQALLRQSVPVFLSTLACALALLATSACAPPPPLAPESRTPTVANTVWEGTDSDGDHYVYRFQSSGALHYTSRTGNWKNGTWSQDDRTIYFEMNSKYSEYKGHIVANQMEGEASNTVGRRWTWRAKKVE